MSIGVNRRHKFYKMPCVMFVDDVRKLALTVRVLFHASGRIDSQMRLSLKYVKLSLTLWKCVFFNECRPYFQTIEIFTV